MKKKQMGSKEKEHKIGNWIGTKSILIAVVVIIAFISAASAGSNKFPDKTPYQESVMKSIANGKLATSESPVYALDILEKDDKHMKLKATTKIKFKNSKEAGLDKWKKFEIKDLTGVKGVTTNKPGDYDQKIKDYIKQQIQSTQDPTERAKKLKAWNNYDFETGQRTITIEETYSVTYPDQSQAATSYIKSLQDPILSNTNDVLMGFTFNPPTIDWTVAPKIEVCDPTGIFGCFTVAGAEAGFRFNAALGLRLPTEVTLNYPDQLIDRSSYTLSTSILGADWDVAKYSAVNVPAENGNEFVARFDFFLGLKVILLDIDVLDWSISANKDYGKSYTTPFGPGQEFPIPDLDLNPDDTGLKFDLGVASLGIGINIDPDIGSKTISADYLASGDGIGTGSIEYNEPGVTYNFGPITAGDYSPTTDKANILLNNYKYFFDICKFDVAANIALDIFGDLGEIGTPYLPLFTIDASDLTGGLYLGTHSGTTADSAQTSIFVQKLADLSMVVSDNGQNAVAGLPYQYTLTVHNGGPSDATGVVVTDTLPIGMTFSSAIGAVCSANGQVVTCDPLSILAGSNAVITITTNVASSVVGGTTLQNIAEVKEGFEPDPDTSNNLFSSNKYVESRADLSITKKDSAFIVIVGNPLTYTINVTNSGPSDAYNVKVADTLPSTVTLSSTTGCINDPNGAPECDLGTIPAGSQKSYTMTVIPNSGIPSTITNKVQVSSDAIDSNSANDIATDNTYVVVPNKPGIEIVIPSISLSGTNRDTINGQLTIKNDAKDVPATLIDNINFLVSYREPPNWIPVNTKTCAITPNKPPFMFDAYLANPITVGFSCTLDTPQIPTIPTNSVVKVTANVQIFNNDRTFAYSISQHFD